MRKSRRVLSLFLIFLMIVITTTSYTTVIPAITVEAASKVPSLETGTKTLYVGYHSYKLKVKNLSSQSKLTYKSSNTQIATVTGSGIIKPVAKGLATITVAVKQNGKLYQLKCKVTVKKPGISFTQSSDYLNVGETYTFKAKTEGKDGEVDWSTSDPSIATIDSDGNVSAVTGGSITVTAKSGSLSAKCDLTIGFNTLGTFSTNLVIYEDTTIWIHTSNEDMDEELLMKSTSSDVASYQWGKWSGVSEELKIKPLKKGKDTLTITSTVSSDRLTIHLTVIDKPEKKVLTSQEIYDKCVPSTVEISVTTANGDFLGSGFFIGDDRIVTNYHVIEGAKSIVVKTSDNKEYTINKILGFNATLDIAILELKMKHKYLTMCQQVTGGEDIYAIGSPLGLTQTMSKGMVSTPSRVIDDVNYIQTDASISHGNSGGPLVNSYGEVIGINTMYMEDGQNLNFAINIGELQKIYTNEPISVDEYNKEYNDYWSAWYSNNVITEDPTLSQDYTKCQTAASGLWVKGTIKSSEYGDVYYLKVTKDCDLQGIVYFGNELDYTSTFVSVYTYSGTRIGDFKADDSNDNEYFSQKVTAGEYLIMVYFQDGYTGRDVDYYFKLKYD